MPLPSYGAINFYTYPGETVPHHVVIYLGGDRILEAPQTGENVRYGSLSEFPGQTASVRSITEPRQAALRGGGVAHRTGVVTLIASHTLLAAGVYPNFNGVGGAGQLKTVIGALMTIVLIVAVLMMIVCAAAWAVASAHGNYQTATKARTGLLVAVGAAALDGGGIAWINFLLGIGPTL